MTDDSVEMEGRDGTFQLHLFCIAQPHICLGPVALRRHHWATKAFWDAGSCNWSEHLQLPLDEFGWRVVGQKRLQSTEPFSPSLCFKGLLLRLCMKVTPSLSCLTYSCCPVGWAQVPSGLFQSFFSPFLSILLPPEDEYVFFLHTITFLFKSLHNLTALGPCTPGVGTCLSIVPHVFRNLAHGSPHGMAALQALALSSPVIALCSPRDCGAVDRKPLCFGFDFSSISQSHECYVLCKVLD